MTYSGNLNITKPNTVKIPAVTQSIVTPECPEPSFGTTFAMQYYYDDNNMYFVNKKTIKSSIDSIINGSLVGNAQVAGTSYFLSNIYPTPINGYFYCFSMLDETSAGVGGNILRASVDSPLAWYDTGVVSDSNAVNPTIYEDGYNIYLFGGLVSGVETDAIDVAPIADPTNFTTSVNTLPAATAYSAITVAGSRIYLYGGSSSSLSDAKDEIWSAPLSDPTDWTIESNTLPAPIYNAAIYNDGTTIYLFGGIDPMGLGILDTIYSAPVSDPTNFTLLGGTLPTFIDNPRVIASGDYLYLFSSASSTPYKAELSDLQTWTTTEVTLSTVTKSSHLIQDIANNKLYNIGGYDASGLPQAAIQSADLNNPVEWIDEVSSFTTDIAGGEVIKTKDYYFIVGGEGVTGGVYQTLISDPLSFSILPGTGPTRSNGRACFIDDQLFYFGGQQDDGYALADVSRATIDGPNLYWRNEEAGDFSINLPIALTQFSLIVAGPYVYILGGHSGYSTMNSNIYRCLKNKLVAGPTQDFTWENVGTLSTPTVDASVVVINNFVYIVAGGNDGFGGPQVASTKQITYASLSDLANGKANFTTEIIVDTIAFAQSKAICLNDVIYFIGGRVAATGSTTTNKIFKTDCESIHTLISQKVPELLESLPTIDNNSGALGTYSSFQRTGMLPWLVSNK